MAVAMTVALMGSVGAMARYLLDGFVQDRTAGLWPFGTLAVNVLGSFLLGVIAGVVVDQHWSNDLRAIAGTGFCGGFTTWSAMTWEVVQLGRQGARTTAIAYMAGSLVACTAAVWAGLVLGRLA